MEKQKLVVCPENKDLATYMWSKMKELAEQPKGISEHIDMTLQKAYSSVCNSKNRIQTLKEFSHTQGVGKWILRLMKGFFETQEGTSEPEEPDEGECLAPKGKKTRGPKRYVPQKNSVAYALLVTLYRAATNGSDFMRKQEIIDGAEASGLSRVPIVPEKGRGKLSFGNSPSNWYSGWSCMKTLITKGLVVKSSNPAKYRLTPEGQEAARECLVRSGLADSTDHFNAEGVSNLQVQNEMDLEFVRSNSAEEVALHSVGSSKQKKVVEVPLKSIERFTQMGYLKEQVLHAFSEISETSNSKDISSLWPEVLCRLREEEVYCFPLQHQNTRVDCLPISSQVGIIRGSSGVDACRDVTMHNASCTVDSDQSCFTLKACSTFNPGSYSSLANMNSLAMPPLNFGESFRDVFEVILILDDREQFAKQGSNTRKIIDNIRSRFKIPIEVRRLPVGDGIWIARHKHLESEYVLDFIVERKKVDDLRCSIRDSRYKDQKLRLVRCGLKKLIYLIEGDLNTSEVAESMKTACLTTEILDEFDVQRTSGLGDTLKKYGYLTQAITHYYRSQTTDEKDKRNKTCPPFDEFVKRCQDMDKMTVGDVFANQLMQVPQVTEEVAIAVLDLYPTLISLARAYSLLDGDVSAQEEMLWKQTNNAVSTSASKNIYRLVWAT